MLVHTHSYSYIYSFTAGLYVDDAYFDDDEDDFQRALTASMEDQNGDNVLQLMLQSKQVFKTNEVLPLLGKQLEYISRLCFDRIQASRSSPLVSVQNDAPALVEMWKDLQATISLGFQAMYSIEEQKELISYSIKKSEDWMHMIPSVSMAVSKDEFLLTSISSNLVIKPVIKRKVKNAVSDDGVGTSASDDKSGNTAKQTEHDLKHSVDINHITCALKNLKKHDISITCLIKAIFDEVERTTSRRRQ